MLYKTKKQRAKVYQKIIDCNFVYPSDPTRRYKVGICYMLKFVTGDESLYECSYRDSNWPELDQLKPNTSGGCYWFDLDEQGDNERRFLLEFAIQLCNE